MTSSELLSLGRRYRANLPDDFINLLPEVRGAFARGESPAMRLKARKPDANRTIREAILKELQIYLCTDDPRYRGLRGKGKKLSEAAVGVIAGFVASAVGIAAGFAIAAVAYLAAFVLDIGASVFCRIMA